MLVAGIVVKDYKTDSQARRKRLREHRLTSITEDELKQTVDAYLQGGAEREAELASQMEQKIREYVEEERYRSDFLEPLRKDILRGLSFVHDYRQINAQIRQNINVILETRYPDGSLEEKLENALAAEKAIYQSARFLEEKLSVAKFLLEPEWLNRPEECVKFRVHGMITKYVRIYQSEYDRAGVALHLAGRSLGEIIANPQACGVIPHTFLDNALKYSKKGARVELFLKDEEEGVYVQVRSYGPKIDAGEREKIFDPFYRGQEAKRVVAEGAGYGLYVAQLIAQAHLGVRIAVQQDANSTALGFRTTFSIQFPWRAAVVP